ncbi:hypothetical protein HA402_000302 [Bradysia odoriphaga]|nr:hypothetical protein HA402_000302 [Bradysia odoriphaga]
MSNSDGVLQIDLDLEDELLKSDTESAHTNTVKQGDHNYEAELLKQNVLSHNLSIMGLPATVDEDLNLLSLKIFQVIGCAIQRSDIFGCYRIKKANKFTSIFIIKFNDFATKQRIMKAKVDKVIKVRDVIGSDTTAGNSTLFINNHVTPFFGKLMAEGRKAVKDKRIQSVWLNRNGCNIRLEANGPERIYRSTDELYRMLSSLDHRSSTSNPFNTGSKRQRSEDDDNSPKNMHRAKNSDAKQELFLGKDKQWHKSGTSAQGELNWAYIKEQFFHLQILQRRRKEQNANKETFQFSTKQKHIMEETER